MISPSTQRRRLMARNCPSYKTMYTEQKEENRRLRRELREAERALMDDDEDEDVTIHATSQELKSPVDPLLNLEDRAVLIVWL
jgi:hypothetical protein